MINNRLSCGGARRIGRRLAVVAMAVLMAVSAGAVAARAEARPTYRNAVSDAFSDTFADPSVILGKDGWWYAYSTADPLYAGNPTGVMHIARTRDWVRWQYRGTVFNDSNRPSYATPTAGLWAPDIRYIRGQYVLYYTVTDTTLNPGEDPGIGVATAPTPGGPWTPRDEPIIAPRLRPGTTSYLGTIDPAGFTDVTGQHYLYFGGYNGGFWGTKVSADGLTAEPSYTQVAIDNRYEGGYLVRHDGWYYFMASTANCCAGPTTGYSVYTGRSRSPLGPFVDADGISLMAPAVGGTNLVTQNGNRWIGTGHHAIATDAEGRDFLVYHAIDRFRPWLNQPFGINRRPMLIDRIDWVDGWPRTRAGAGPSDTAQPAPVTTSGLGIVAYDPARRGWRRLTEGPTDDQAGATARLRGVASTVADAPASRVRVRFDVDSDRAVTVMLGRRRDTVEVTVDPRRGRLSVTTRADGRGKPSRSSTALPDLGRGWETVVVEVDRGSVLAWVLESDLSDPRAEVRVHRSGLDLPAAPVRLRSSGASLIDNVTVRGLAREADRLVPVPQAGRLLAAEEFTDASLTGWTWVRKNASAVPSGGQLRWPVEGADLVGRAPNTAGVLLRQPPTGSDDWIVETKLTLDLGVDSVRNFQQAGLVAYRNDDDFARLSKVAIWNTRQTEYGRELVATQDGATSYGGAILGTPGPTTWLRLAYHRNAAGEHQYRAATSRDGRSWTWGAVWTFSPGSEPRIGLVAHGGSSPAVTASFDYVRFYATTWPTG